MAHIDASVRVEDIFSRFSKMETMAGDEQKPERDLILMIVLGMKIWVQRETDLVEHSRQVFSSIVKGLTIRNTMDQWNDALCLLMVSIDRSMAPLAIGNPQHQLLYELREECYQTLTVINKSRPSFHQPITE